VPEALWIVAKRYKAALARVLEELVADGFCSRRQAFEIGRAILGGNARRLYQL
jgi:hypothetical protein